MVMNSATKVRASSIERTGIRKRDQWNFIDSRAVYHLRVFFYDTRNGCYRDILSGRDLVQQFAITIELISFEAQFVTTRRMVGKVNDG
jgi:hypothetical protein